MNIHRMYRFRVEEGQYRHKGSPLDCEESLGAYDYTIGQRDPEEEYGVLSLRPREESIPMFLVGGICMRPRSFFLR